MTEAISIRKVVKDEKINISKDYSTMTEGTIEVGWDQARYNGQVSADADVILFLGRRDPSSPTGKAMSKIIIDGKTLIDGSIARVPRDMTYYHTKDGKHVSGAIFHSGDVQEGTNAEVEETIKINFPALEAWIEKMEREQGEKFDFCEIAVTLHDTDKNGNPVNHTFKNVENLFARVKDQTGKVHFQYDVDLMNQDDNAVVVCEFFKRGGSWWYGAVGMGFNDGLEGLLRNYGFTSFQ